MYCNTSHPKARKPHRCAWCGERIEKGEIYSRSFVVCEGDAWTKKLHLECECAEKVYDFDDDVHYYHCQMGRGHNHERFEDTAYNCAKKDCPACLSLPLVTPESADISLIIQHLLDHVKPGQDLANHQLHGWIGTLYRVAPNDINEIIKVLVGVGAVIEEFAPHVYTLDHEAEKLI